MGLREQAVLDAQAIIEATAEFAVEVVLIDPAGTEHAIKGLPTDIGLSTDPETGQAVSLRRASIAFSMLRLDELELDLPAGIASSTQKPWRVRMTDARGKVQTFKVVETQPDRTLGVHVCFLEIWKSA